MKSLITLITLFYFSTIKMKILATLTMLLFFTTNKMKFLTLLTTLFSLTFIKMKSLTTIDAPAWGAKGGEDDLKMSNLRKKIDGIRPPINHTKFICL